MKTALLLNAVDPGIGGVLIRGQKGTGKTTAVRALAGILPTLRVVDGCPYHCPPDEPSLMHEECLFRFQAGDCLPEDEIPVPLVELPLNATEDRLAGTLHIEHALATGQRKFEPGLLAAANRGILYIDEVNLLEDHLVDMLLDAAASGVNTVEREGISIRHPARFILIGTMNPEEGELRPQFLDRFGLCVTVSGADDPVDRMEILRRRMEYDRNPAEFSARWRQADEELSELIRNARKRLSTVQVPDPLWQRIVRLTSSAGVQGHRADIAIMKAAVALSALTEQQSVTEEVLREAARLVLPHRLPAELPHTPEESREAVDRVFRQTEDGKTPAGFSEEEEEIDIGDIEAMQVPGGAAAGSILYDFIKKKLQMNSTRETGSN